MQDRRIFTEAGLQYSDSEIQQFAQQIQNDGFVEIANFFPSWVLEEASDYVERRNLEIDSGYMSLRAEDMPQSIFVKIKESDKFREFLDRIRLAAKLQKPENGGIHCVVRSINGSRSVNKKSSDKYHFDAYDLTASMPVVIPSENNRNRGDFVLFLRRRSSSGLMKTLFYKSVFQNRYARRVAKSAFFFRLFKGKVVRTKPGSLYVFLGFRTYHGNRQIDPGVLRVTALFHYSNPLEKSSIIRRIEAKRKRPQNAV